VDLKNKCYAGIDPGGVTSSTAIVIIEDGEKYKIKSVYAIQPINFYGKKVMRKFVSFIIKTICNQHDNLFITIEEAFLKGAANKGFLKLIGSVEDKVDVDLFIAPTSVKKMVTGSGKAEKDEMAEKLLGYPFDQKSKNIIKKLIKEEKWDETDAIAIALCGLIKEQYVAS